MCLTSRILKRKTGPAIGYRTFNFARTTGGVRSLFHRRARGWSVAMVTRDDPRADANHGFHALATLRGVQREYPERAIYAQVQGTGIVVHHVHGHRASRVRILRFYVRVDDARRRWWLSANQFLTEAELARLRRRYPDVPVTILPSTKER